MKKFIFLGVFLSCATLAATAATPTPKQQKPSIRESAKKATPKDQEVKVGTKGDELYFDKNTISAKAGTTLKLTFTNQASPSSGLLHNFVLIQPGKNDEVAQAGIVAGPDKGYVPESPAVLTHTKLLSPGQSETLTIAVPKTPGDYPYLCTFPGHPLTMKGTLRVS